MLIMLTPYIYFITYLTETGYCSYFGIPPGLISLSPGNISSIAAILGILYAGIHILDAILDKLLFLLDRSTGQRIPGLHYLASSNILTGVVLMFIVLSLVDPADNSTRRLFLLISAILLVVAIAVSIRNTTEGNAPEKPDGADTDSPPEQRSLISRMFDRKVTALILMTALVTFPGTDKGGEYLAKKQDSFMKVNGSEEMLGVVIYGDKIIAKEYRNGTLGMKTIVIPIRDGTTIEELTLSPPPLIDRTRRIIRIR